MLLKTVYVVLLALLLNYLIFERRYSYEITKLTVIKLTEANNTNPYDVWVGPENTENYKLRGVGACLNLTKLSERFSYSKDSFPPSTRAVVSKCKIKFIDK